MDPIVTSALISAGTSIFGGLFGKKKQKTETNLNFKKIRDDGVAAGFNPLTALAAASGAGATTTTSTGPSLSTGQFLANAVGEVGQAFADSWFNKEQDAKDQEVERIKLETMKADLANINARTQYLARETPFGSSIPRYETDTLGPRVRNTGPVLMSPTTNSDKRESATDIEPMRQTPTLSEFRTGVPGSGPYKRPNPDTADTGLGEYVGWGVVHGLPMLRDEMVYSYRNPKTPEGVAHKKMGDWIGSKAESASKWLHEKDDEFFNWNKRQARRLYDYWSKPGRKSHSPLSGAFMN